MSNTKGMHYTAYTVALKTLNSAGGHENVCACFKFIGCVGIIVELGNICISLHGLHVFSLYVFYYITFIFIISNKLFIFFTYVCAAVKLNVEIAILTISK